MKSLLTALLPLALVAGSLGIAVAKLPAAPPMDPAKADEKKAKDAASAASAAALQAKAEDRAAAHYLTRQKAKGNVVTPQMQSNWRELEAKAKEAASKVPGAQPAPATQPMAAAKPTAVKK